MTDEQVIALLREPHIFNYASYLEPPVTSDQKLLNTIELFAFGDTAYYERHRSEYITLDEGCLRKLVSLTLFSLLGKNVGNELLISEVLADLVHLQSPAELEDLLIDLAVSGYVCTRIDQHRGLVLVQEVRVLRDAYNADNVKLRVFREGELETQSVEWARAVLSKWLESKIGPTKDGLVENA